MNWVSNLPFQVNATVPSEERSAITCAALSNLPKIGDGLVIPKNNHFIDLDQEDGELKVPAGISLQEPGGR